MGHILLEEEVGVEADGGDVVDHVHRGLQKMTFVWAGHEPKTKSFKGWAFYTLCFGKFPRRFLFSGL